MQRALNELREINEKGRQLLAAQYTWTRDKDANLYLAFKDGMEVKLPYIPFRPYQIDVAKKLFLEDIKRQLHEWPRRAGKEVVTWNLILQAAITAPGLYMMVYPTTSAPGQFSGMARS